MNRPPKSMPVAGVRERIVPLIGHGPHRSRPSRSGRGLGLLAGAALAIGFSPDWSARGQGEKAGQIVGSGAPRTVEIDGSNAVSQPPGPEPAEGTALAHVVNTMRALQRGDVNGFVAGFDATADEISMLTAIAGFSREALDFRRKYVDSYGVDYWNAFQNAEDPAGVFDFHFTHVLDEHIEALKRLDNAVLERDRAVRLPNTGADTALLRGEDGSGWLIDATPLVPAGFATTTFAGLMEQMARMVNRYGKVLGKEGVDPRDLDFDMGRAEAEIFHQAIHGEALPDDAPPARLDLQRLLAEDSAATPPARTETPE